MKIVITIPALNEENTLSRVLEEINDVMKNTSYRWQVLVVDDGSTDKTRDVAKKHGAIVISHKRNKGLAEAFKTEVKNALKEGADIIVHTDADGQYPAKHIPELIKKIEEGYDLVLGSRFAGKIEEMPFLKRIGNKAFSRTLSHFTKTKLTDVTTGFRAFTKEVAEEINIINTFTYTQEQIIKASLKKFRIAEIPIEAKKTRESRLFRSSWEYAWKAWINIFRIYRDYEPLRFFGRIGSIMFLLGFIIGLYLLYEILTTGEVGGIPRVVLSGVLMLTGIQIILFGFLADMWQGR
ncbi:MAG: glycosyltransferase family 2 protein [Candidatus Pacearchaeota archaeon]